MDVYKSISRESTIQVANSMSQEEREDSIYLTPSEVAELRLARQTRFCGRCRNLRWRHLGDPLPIDIENLKKSYDEKWCYTCGLLLDWVERLMATNRGNGEKGLRQTVKGVNWIFRNTLKLEIMFEGQVSGMKWELHTLSGK